ncbi:NAD(P)-dependent oxidoreductase [Amaricoccus tamworthensis]|uniref:NAD(P)-dependent oxidoreductase n=1 Tax=Amaricoccus tamworthensis TaxID=57002 RepID=UPI003C7CBE30
MSKPILIMGATSGIGQCAVNEALSRNLPVRAFARSAADMEPATGLEPYPGDALDHQDVAGALKGARAVIHALGIRERPAMLWQEETLFSKSTGILLQEMNTAGVSRLLAVTGIGAGRSKSALSFIERAAHKAVFRKPYEDKDRQEEMIIQSDTDWTIVRPVILTNGAKSGKYRVLRKPEEWRMGLISRNDVASYLIDAIEADSDVKSDVVLAN